MDAPKIPGYTYVGTTTVRKVIKSEIDKSPEGIKKLLTEIYGDDARFTEEDYQDYYNQMIQAGNLRQVVTDWVNPLYDKLRQENTKNSKKKAGELLSFGRFVKASNKFGEVKILSDAEPPDFIIQYREDKIGVEITGIYDEEFVKAINSVKKLLRKCEAYLESNTSIKGNFLMYFFQDKFNLTKGNEQQLVEEICNYIIAVDKVNDAPHPNYIKLRFKDESEHLDLVLFEEYILKELATAKVLEAVKDKEKDLPKYKADQDLNKCWLLITLDGASSISSFDYSSLQNFEIKSSFDKIFIFDVFAGKIIKGVID